FAGGTTFFSIKISNSVSEEDERKIYRRRDRNHGYGNDKIRGVLEKYAGRFEMDKKEHMMIITIYLPI
ncbi:MAG: GHKL domain-containing protein, partial [Lachnospiraceae bacterium]|nr:GHKL domain-containing protein [Lachnospiraceae bacterium]